VKKNRDTWAKVRWGKKKGGPKEGFDVNEEVVRQISQNEKLGMKPLRKTARREI